MQTKRRELFTTVRTEGAILPADLLQRIADGDSGLEGLKPEDFHRVGERLNEVINGAWNRLLGQWQTFQAALAKLPESDAATSVTRERWLLPLFRELDYGRLATVPAIEVNGKSYPISHGWQKTPIHLVGWRVEMDRRTAGVAGAARTSPHSVVQELLNQSDDRLWGFVSNGQRLRILRNNISLTRQAFVEFDLEAMMDGEVYADFALFWLVCHQSRVEGDRPEQCWLEKWSRTAQETGTRALDTLRQGVEDAIKALGRGLLGHQANTALRQKLRDGGQKGGLDTQDYYRQVLRLVYRLLFLFAAEDRGLLLLPSADEETREKYARYYSTARLRHLAERHRGTRHCDLYQGLAVVMQKLGMSGGCPELGLPTLGGFLWSDRAMPALADCRIANTDFLEAIRALAFTVDGNVLRTVDYKNLGSEELGSIYESLLELHPKINADAATFELDVAAGHERKTTGSYYTPTNLINCLLDSALDPVLDKADTKPTTKEAEAAILALKVCDPTCGSGHFLIAAAHRIAKHLAAVRTGDEEPAPEAYREALRHVIGRCIFGVDINPMAVELCKINLWLESLEPGKPLSFLDHHIQCGNSLLGTTPALMNEGIPDEAFTPIEGDDKKLCTECKKNNRDERRGQKRFKFEGSGKPWERMGDFAVSLANLDAMNDDSLEAVRSKEDSYTKLVTSADYLSGRFWADAWCAAFVWKKNKQFDYAITEDVFRRIERNPHDCSPWMRLEIQKLAEHYNFFHWHLAFPSVFRVPKANEEPENREAGWSGGFDVVLGNPPWEQLELTDEMSGDDKETLLRVQHYLTHAGTLPLTGAGRKNLYALVCERAMHITNPRSRIGLVLPTGIVTDMPCEALCRHIIMGGHLVSLFDFENRGRFFVDVHDQYRITLLTLTANPSKSPPVFGFNLDDPSDTLDAANLLTLEPKVIDAMSPTRFSVPLFESQQDARMASRVYSTGVTLAGVEQHPEVDLRSGLLLNFDQRAAAIKVDADDPNVTKESDAWLPVYEGEYFHRYDHRFATYRTGRVGATEDAVKRDANARIVTATYVRYTDAARRWGELSCEPSWCVGLRRQSNVMNESTSIATILPVAVAEGSVSCFFGASLTGDVAMLLCSNLNTYVFDYVVRMRLSGRNFSKSVYEQIPFVGGLLHLLLRQPLRLNALDALAIISPRVLELTYTSWDLEPFARNCGNSGPPFRWDPTRRFLLRCEVDAIYFHLYRLDREDVDYIMETFPILKRRDEEQHGEYRTKRVILQIYDAMAEAIRTGRPYHTLLDPPPGSPAAGLPDWKPGKPLPANWPSHIHPPCHASGTAAPGQSPSQPRPPKPATPAAWQMTRGQYQDYCKTQGRTDVTENNLTYWREVESAIQSGKPVPANVLAEYRLLKRCR